MAQFAAQHNMTDVLAALSVLTDIDCPERGEALTRFYERWKEDFSLVDELGLEYLRYGPAY